LATTTDIEQHMNEIRDGSLPETLPSEGHEGETPPAASDPNADPRASTYGAGSTTLGVWALGTGLFGGFPHVNYTAGQGTAGFDYHAGRWLLIPEVNVRWQHEYLQTANNISAAFIGGPSTTVIGAGIDSDAIWGSEGLSAVRGIFSIFSFYSIQAGGNFNAQEVDLGVRLHF
jgi:hypothetical protein